MPYLAASNILRIAAFPKVIVHSRLMPIGSRRSSVTLAEIVETCEKFYARDGFVKWADVARVHDVTRQAVQFRLKKAVAAGEVDDATFKRWASPTSRAAASRSNRLASREREKLQIRITLTEENAKWLREQCVFRGVNSADILNGLVNKARESSGGR